MVDKEHAISSDLQTQWQDHFHMRDQTWKVLQYSILFFLGVVGLEIKGGANTLLLLVSYLAVFVTSAMGCLVAIHHRRRQKEKFEIITIYQQELGLGKLIEPVLSEAKKRWFGGINTSTFIVVMQAALLLVSGFMICKGWKELKGL